MRKVSKVTQQEQHDQQIDQQLAMSLHPATKTKLMSKSPGESVTHKNSTSHLGVSCRNYILTQSMVFKKYFVVLQLGKKYFK